MLVKNNVNELKEYYNQYYGNYIVDGGSSKYDIEND